MGNKSCEQLQLDSYESQAYGEFKIIDKNNKKYARIVKILQLSSDFKKSIEASLVKRQQIKDEGLCELYSFDVQSSQQITEVILEYEYFECSLFQKKQLVFGKNQRFSAEQLIKIIETISRALKQLSKNKIKHGCINFNTILCTQNGYKITDVSTTSYLSSMQLVQKGSRKQPVSKKLIEIINQSYISRKPVKRSISLQDDIFSLGIIILSLATKVEISQFYKFIKNQQKIFVQLNNVLIEDYLYLLRKRYNRNLEKLVRKMIYPGKQCTEQSFSRQIQKRDNIETNQNSNNSIDQSDDY